MFHYGATRNLDARATQPSAADGFTWTLLKLARFSDSLFIGGAPMLKHHFSKEEYRDAKKNMKELVDVNKDSIRKNGKRRKDLESDNLF